LGTKSPKAVPALCRHSLFGIPGAWLAASEPPCLAGNSKKLCLHPAGTAFWQEIPKSCAWARAARPRLQNAALGIQSWISSFQWKIGSTNCIRLPHAMLSFSISELFSVASVPFRDGAEIAPSRMQSILVGLESGWIGWKGVGGWTWKRSNRRVFHSKIQGWNALRDLDLDPKRLRPYIPSPERGRSAADGAPLTSQQIADGERGTRSSTVVANRDGGGGFAGGRNSAGTAFRPLAFKKFSGASGGPK